MEMAPMGCAFGGLERIRECKPRKRLVSRGLNEKQCYRRRKCLVRDKAEDFKKRTVRYGTWNLDIDPEALSRNVCMFREVRGGLRMSLTISVRFTIRFRWFGQRALVYRVPSLQ